MTVIRREIAPTDIASSGSFDPCRTTNPRLLQIVPTFSAFTHTKIPSNFHS